MNYTVSVITGTSVDYAKTSIKTASLLELREALAIERRNRKRKTMIRMLEARIRKLENA